MRRFLGLEGLVIGLAALAAACGPTVNVEQERTALMSADRAWAQATKEPEKFVSFFAEGGSIYAPGMPLITGVEAIRTSYTEMAKTPGFSLSWAPTKADVAASGDLGMTAGTYEMVMGGTSEKGKYVTMWKKQVDGAWKVTEDIFNADAAPKSPAGDHLIMPAASLKWGDAPHGMPAGMRATVVMGDPSQAGPYVMRAQMPANYRIPPHWHPTQENVTVLSGTVSLGMGEKVDQAAMKDLPAGGFMVVPPEMRHYFLSKTASTIQIHGIGPFGITYVNAADDPRNTKSN